MIKQLLSLASIIFVIFCMGAIVFHFVPLSFLSGMIEVFNNEGMLEVESSPKGAAVYINSKHIGQTPLRKALTNGTYHVKVILSGYQTYARQIAIEKNDTAMIHAKLSKEYGKLHVSSTPSNAFVYIDGKRQGQLTPLEIQVPQGRYFVKVEKERFDSITEEVFVDQGKTMTVEADLTPQIGKIVIETVPPGAQAYIGNDLIGTTPLIQDKPVGKYVITLKKKRFRNKVIEATVAADETLNIDVDLAERAGALKVTTNPPGAEVHINDAYQGETPLRIEKKPGVYQVTINRKGFRELNEEIAIEDNITKNIHRDLDPVIVEFRLDSDPSHAKIWLNSEDMGYTPAILHMKPGMYTVRITKPGYKNYVEEVHIKEGAFIQLKPLLEKEKTSH